MGRQESGSANRSSRLFSQSGIKTHTQGANRSADNRCDTEVEHAPSAMTEGSSSTMRRRLVMQSPIAPVSCVGPPYSHILKSANSSSGLCHPSIGTKVYPVLQGCPTQRARSYLQDGATSRDQNDIRHITHCVGVDSGLPRDLPHASRARLNAIAKKGGLRIALQPDDAVLRACPVLSRCGDSM